MFERHEETPVHLPVVLFLQELFIINLNSQTFINPLLNINQTKSVSHIKLTTQHVKDKQFTRDNELIIDAVLAKYQLLSMFWYNNHPLAQH
jgi:hypothetical protein